MPRDRAAEILVGAPRICYTDIIIKHGVTQ